MNIPSIDIDLWSDDVLANPYPAYAELRDLGPVVYDAERDVYILSRYDDVRSAVQDWERFSSASGVGVGEQGNRFGGSGILTSDPPRHEQLRKVMNPPLLARSLSAHQTFIDEVAARMVGDLVAKPSFEAVSELAQPFSIDVVSSLAGFPEEGREHFMRWADAGFNIMGPDNTLAQEGFAGFYEMFQYCFKSVTPDQLADQGWGRQFYAAGDAGNVEPDACPGLVMAVVWAGMDTTVNSISSALYLFGQHPDQWQRLRADRSLMQSAIAEILRIEPPVQRFTRVTTSEVDVSGSTIPVGARVVLLFGSANRDERRFDQPDVFDISRNPVDHLAFGRGVHRCVGASLAQQEVKAVLDQFLDRVETIAVREAEWRRNNSLHGLERLVVSTS